MIKKICEVCGAEFSVKPFRAKTARFCSRECKASFLSQKVEVKCAICGKLFKKGQTRVKPHKKYYCSNSCYAKARSEMMRGPNNPLWKENKLTHKCDWCGKVFEITPSRLKNNNSCCSEDCSRKLSSRIYRGENHHSWNRVTKTCLYCGKEYTVPQSMKETSKYCSRKCQNSHLGKLYSGENSPLWKGGTSFEPYCPKFNNEFKERVREFWGRECGICGKSEYKNGKKLHIHHVNYEKMVCCNNVSPLFIAACSSCHPKTNYNRNYWEEMLTNYIMIWFDGESYNPATSEITLVNEHEITA